MKLLPYAQQHISTEDVDAVSRALQQPAITRGSLVKEFEKCIADYCGATYAVAFNSGTSALMAAYAAVDAGPFDRVLSTPNTFVATVGAAVQRSATPVFIDTDPATGNMDLEQVTDNLDHPTSRGKTIVAPVHFTGNPVDVAAIEAQIKNPDTLIIEDAAHAIGSLYPNGKKVGCCEHSAITIFSFHPAKTITTGEGGMALTNDPALYHRLCLYRNNGMERDPKKLKGEATPWLYEVVELSGNFNFTELQAALGLSQMKRIDQFILKRQSLLNTYATLLEPLEHVKLLTPANNPAIAPHLCVVSIDFEHLKKNRADVMQRLLDQGITTQVHYIPVYRHPTFVAQMGDLTTYFPKTELYYSQALTLPLYYALEEADVERVVAALKDVL